MFVIEDAKLATLNSIETAIASSLASLGRSPVVASAVFAEVHSLCDVLECFRFRGL